MIQAQVVYADKQPDPTESQHVGWGGKDRTVTATLPLGYGVARTPEYGIRRAIWDAAFGYVSGFRKRDILYYLLTRSFSERICEAAIMREQEVAR